jgi:hypothetical protein
MGIYTKLILPQAMQIVGERVNGEQMVGAGKMGVRQQPWMQWRVKDDIEMHRQRRLWRRVRTQTMVPRQLHWRRTRAWSAAMLKGEGHVEIHEGNDARDMRSRRWRCWQQGRIGDGVVEGHEHGSDFFQSYQRTHVKLSQLEGS